MFNSGTLSFVIEKIKGGKSYDPSKLQQRFDSYLMVTHCDPETIFGIQVVMKTLGLTVAKDFDPDNLEDDERTIYNMNNITLGGLSPKGINKMEIGILRSVFLAESNACLI